MVVIAIIEGSPVDYETVEEKHLMQLVVGRVSDQQQMVGRVSYLQQMVVRVSYLQQKWL